MMYALHRNQHVYVVLMIMVSEGSVYGVPVFQSNMLF